MKKTLIFVLCIVQLCVMLNPAVGYSGEDEYIRLHVKAESNSVADQGVKLKVRDGVLYYLQDLQECKNLGFAAKLIQDNLTELEQISEEILRQEGFDQQVTARLTRTDFPDRSYGTLFLPEGEYLALQILIGEAQGENWWCVLYPPLCYGQWEQPIDETWQEAVAVYAEQNRINDEKKNFWWYFNRLSKGIFGNYQ